MFGPREAIMSPSEIFAIGMYLHRWIDDVTAQRDEQIIQRAFEAGCGLLLRNGRADAAEHMIWARDQFLETGDVVKLLAQMGDVQATVAQTLPPGSEPAAILNASAELSFLQVLLAHRSRAGHATISSGLSANALSALPLRSERRAIAEAFKGTLGDTHSTPDYCLDALNALVECLGHDYDARRDEPTPYFEKYGISLVGVRSKTETSD